MIENTSENSQKNTVYALRSFAKTIYEPTSLEDFKENGYLLFKTQEKAMSFVDMCEKMNQKKLISRYEPHEHVQVDDFIYEMVQKSSSFFVTNLKKKF